LLRRWQVFSLIGSGKDSAKQSARVPIRLSDPESARLFFVVFLAIIRNDPCRAIGVWGDILCLFKSSGNGSIQKGHFNSPRSFEMRAVREPVDMVSMRFHTLLRQQVQRQARQLESDSRPQPPVRHQIRLLPPRRVRQLVRH
jgi:hypothetical protein